MSVFAASAFSGRLQICMVVLLLICGIWLLVQRAWTQGVLVAADTSKPSLVVQVGHNGYVNSIAFSPDGKTIASASQDRSVKVWDAETGLLLRTLTGGQEGWSKSAHSDSDFSGFQVGGRITAVSFSPDGKTIANASDQTIKIWNVITGKLIRTLVGHTAQVISVAFISNGTTIESASSDGTVMLWDENTGQIVKTLALRNPGDETSMLVSAAFSPDGATIAGANYGDLNLWNATDGLLIRTLKHQGSFYDIAFSPDSRTIASADGAPRSNDKTVYLWNVNTGQVIQKYLGHTDRVTSVVFSPSGKTIASASASSDAFGPPDNMIKVWDVATGQLVTTLQGHSRWGYSLAFSPDSKTIASSSEANAVTLWNTDTGQLIRTLIGHVAWVSAAAFNPDGKTIANASGNTVVNIWSMETGRPLRTFIGSTDSIGSATFCPDSKAIALGSSGYGSTSNDTIGIWDIDTGKLIRTLEGPYGGIQSISFSPDGKIIANTSKFNDPLSVEGKTVKLWDSMTGQRIRTLSGNSDYIESVAFSPDSKIIAGTGNSYGITGHANVINLWDTDTGQLTKALTGHTGTIRSVAFSPDGKSIASASKDKTVNLWDVETGQIIRTLVGHTEDVNSVAFNPTGSIIASGSSDGTIKLWDANTGQLIRTLTGHLNDVRSVAFSPDGKILISASYDCSVKLWDVDDGHELCSLYTSNTGDWAVITPDGRFDGSEGGLKQLHYVVGLEPIDLTQLKDRYYEPGLLAKLMGFSKVPLRDVPPLDAIALYPQIDDPIVAQDARSATIHLTNQGGGIGRVVVQVNGKEIAHDARGAGIDPDAKDATVTVQIPKSLTVPGDEANHLEVVAYNADGGVASRSVVAVFTEPEAAPATPPRLFAVIAGVSDYAGPSLHLNFAAKDARDMAQAMALGANRLFIGGTDIQLLTSDAGRSLKPGKDANGISLAPDIAVLPATKSGFTEAFAHIQAQHPNPATDVLIVYLAGHGLSLATSTDSSLYCYLTQDATSGDKDSLRSADLRASTTVTSDDLADWTNTQVPILKQVIVLDTCAAGAAAAKLSEKRDIDSDQVRAADRLNGRTGFWVLMGCAADRSSYEASRFSQGLLTYSLLDYMAQGKLTDGQVDVSAWFEHAEEEVPKLATDAVGGIQEPRGIVPKEARSFPVALLDADTQGRIPLARALPVVLRPVFLSDDFTDPLNLTGRVGKALSDLSESAQARGSDDAAKPSVDLIYMDADELPGAARPSGGYTVTGEGANATATVKITLTFSPAPGSSDTPRKVALSAITGGVGDEAACQALAQKVAEAVARAVGK